MKSWFSKKSNLLFLVIICFFFYRQGPVFFKNFKKSDVKIETKEYQVLNAEAQVSLSQFPPPNRKALGVFWATWCGPCLIEMKRLKTSVAEGKIDPTTLYAINPFESSEIVRKFLRSNKFPFTFIDAPEVSTKLEIELTPTTILVENNVIKSMSSGMSLIGIFKAEKFLKQ